MSLHAPLLRSLLLGIVFCAGTHHALAFELVSAQEMRASMSAAPTLTAKAFPVPGAPHIEIVHPRLDAPIASPTAIQLLFVPTGSSTVRPETFKVFYGRLRIDITQRLMNAAKVTPEGISVKEASLPKGSHRLLLSIEDIQGRQGFKTLDLEIH